MSEILTVSELRNRKCVKETKQYLHSLGYDIDSISYRYISLVAEFKDLPRPRLKGLARFIMIINRYRDDFYAPGNTWYRSAKNRFDEFISQ